MIHTQMDHFELNLGTGKVVQPPKQMGVDDVVGAHHRRSKLSEVVQQTMQKEARQSDVAVNFGTDSDRMKTTLIVETNPGKAIAPQMEIGEAKSGIFDQMRFRSRHIVRVVRRVKQTKWIDSDD